MKRHILSIGVIFFLTAIFLTACRGKEQKKADESVWQGVAPGMEDLTALTERTEYYDVAVESEDLFAFGLEGMPQGRPGVTMALRGAAGIPLGTQFLQGEPVQLWAETGSDGADIYLYRKDGRGIVTVMEEFGVNLMECILNMSPSLQSFVLPARCFMKRIRSRKSLSEVSVRQRMAGYTCCWLIRPEMQ